MKVTLKNIMKEFTGSSKSSKTVVAVDNFNIEIPDGKLIGLLGPSGCGKSTVLNILCGLLRPTRGKIFFGDDDVTNLPAESRGVGMVFQNYALYPHLTVKQNIIFPLENLRGAAKISKAEMEKRATKVAGLVQITELLDRKPYELSGGQQQRVAIARALIKTPRILLMDEPLSNLDARLRLQTRDEIRHIQKETGVTTIFVTHDQEEAMNISDEIIVMQNGEIQQVGKPQYVYDNPTNLFVAKFLGTPPIHTFKGRIIDGTIFVGSNELISISKIADREVIVAIRPEGFIPNEEGRLVCKLNRVNTVGRDITVECTHPQCENDVIRAVINTENKIDDTAEIIRFNIKENKLFLFDSITGERIYFSTANENETPSENKE